MSLRRNVIANYLGQGWTALMSLAFVPLYIKYLGMEAYGLIGVYVVLQAWMSLLDMGITPTLNREMARFTAGAHTSQSIRTLLRSMEVVAAAMALLIALIIGGAADWLAHTWVQVERLRVEEVTGAFSIMGMIVALRFLESIYRGAILGLQRQVWINTVNAGLATVRGVGAVAVLVWWSPTVQAFFWWQVGVSLVSVLVSAMAVHRFIPSTAERVKFSWEAIASIKEFAGGMLATSFLVLLLTQVDKVLLSRMLSLETFGYYMLAASMANMLFQLVYPISQAVYPRLTELVAQNETEKLIDAYHRSAKVISVAILPAGLVLAFFGENVLRLWTGDAQLAQQAAPVLALLSLGVTFNALMNIPYYLTLAYGWTMLGVRINIVAVCILIPLILWATPRYGALGAAAAWLLLNAGYLILAVHLIHRRLIPTEKWRWYIKDVGAPAVVATLLAFVFWMAAPMGNKLLEILWLLAAGVSMMIGAWYAACRMGKRAGEQAC